MNGKNCKHCGWPLAACWGRKGDEWEGCHGWVPIGCLYVFIEVCL